MGQKEISKQLYEISVKLGIDPIYIATFLMLIISLFTIGDLKNWDDLTFTRKSFDIAGRSVTILVMIGSLVWTIKVYIFKSF